MVLFAFLTLGQGLILLVLLVVLGLLALPGTRRYMRALLSSARTAMSCVALCVALALSSVAIYTDLHYAVSGREAEATITKVDTGGKRKHVHYQFTEADGTPQTGTDTTDLHWVAPANGTVTVQYIPGEAGQSRLSRYVVHWFPYLMFVVAACLLLLVIALSVRRVLRTAVRPL